MSATASGRIVVDRPAPHVARLLINRPEKRNSIDLETRQALLDVLPPLLADPETRALVFGGVGGTFSSGGDVATMIDLSEADVRARMRHLAQVCRLVASIRIPVVSAVEGFGAGGAVGLALLGDVIVVGESTKLLFPFFKLGLAPDWGLLRTLPLRVGVPAARRLISEGKIVSGREAVAIGLADQFADPATGGDIMAAAIERASALAALPGEAFARTKARLMSPASSLDEALAGEEDDQAVLLRSDDFREGFAAFTGKRAPDFLKR
jgi:enoyl-CoA hydratase/carnithine racemase